MTRGEKETGIPAHSQGDKAANGFERSKFINDFRI
jgi:hypothetical protein